MALPKKLTYGSYEVLQNPDGSPCLLGQGSFGATYKARHVLLGRINALKVIREDLLNRGSKEDQEETNRFLGEARAVGKLHHPGIAMVHDCALDKGVFYYAMEYCDGGTLDGWCEKHGPMPWSEVRLIALQIASALDYAHTSGFLHRDIKPANIMLNGEGKVRQAKLIDFGLAKKFATDTEASSATVRNDQENFRGNFATASPEQILEKPLDQRSDLFSYGVTLWWLLIGKNPFGDLKRGPLIADRVGPSSYASSLPADWDPEARELLVGLLEKDAEKRIATAHEVVERLGAATVSAAPPPVAAPVASPAVPVEPLQGPPDLEDGYALGGIHVTASQAKLYLAEHFATGQPVIVVIPDLSLDPDARSGMRVAASRQVDFGAYAFRDWRTSSGDDVFVISKPEGCSLLAILRKFGPARFADVLPLFAYLARCFDASQAWTTFGIQVDPGEILIGTRDGGSDLNRFRSWHDLDPHSARCLPFFTSGADHSASSEATLSTSTQEFPPLAQFAALLYRVLAGSAVRYAAFFTSSGYVMASGLSEDGNALLADTICTPESQPSAGRFVQLLASLESQPVAEITPLVDPPSPADIARGKLVPTPPPLAVAQVVARGPLIRAAQPAPMDNSASVSGKVAELERQLAEAKLAAEEDAQRVAAEEAAQRLAAEEARRKDEEANRRATAEMARQAAEATTRANELARQADAAKRAADEAQRKQEEAKRKQEEIQRKANEESARQQAKRLAEEQARRQQEEAKRQAIEEKARQKAAAAQRVEDPTRPPPPLPFPASPALARAASRSPRKVLVIAAVLLALVGVTTALVIKGHEKNRVALAEEKVRQEQEAAERAELAARQASEATRSAAEKQAAEKLAAEKLAAEKLAEAKRIKDAKQAAEPKTSTVRISMARDDAAPKGGYAYTGFIVEDLDGKGAKVNAQQSKTGFQAPPGSRWKVILLGELFGSKDQPLASVILTLPESRETKDLVILLPPALAEIQVVNKYDQADYNQVKIAGPEAPGPAPVKLSGTAPRVITVAELIPEPVLTDEKLHKFPDKSTPLRVPAAGHGKWTLTYTSSRLSNKEVSIPDIGSAVTHRIETPSPFSGRFSLVAPMTRFPEDLNTTNPPPAAPVGDHPPEVDYFNEMVYLENDRDPSRLKLIAEIKQYFPDIDWPHFLCVFMDLDLKNVKAKFGGKMAVLLTYPHVLFVQYQGDVEAVEVSAAGTLTLKFTGTKGVAGDVKEPDIRNWADRYTAAIKSKDAKILNSFLLKSFDEWITWQRLNEDQGAFSLDFGKWKIQDYTSNFRFEIASLDGQLRVNKAVQIYSKNELYHNHATKDASPKEVGAVLLKEPGTEPAREMKRQR